MSSYAAYYNIVCAQRSQAQNKIQEQGLERFQQGNRMASVSESSDSSKRRSSIKSALGLLRPTTETITPAGIYAPLTKRERQLFSRSKKNAEKEERKHSVTQAAVEGALLRR